MFKVIWLLKAKAGVSRDVFRDWYESRHAVLAEKYFGHLLLEYRRNYPVEVSVAETDGQGGGGFAHLNWDYDCVTEWVMPDEAAFHEIMRLSTDPVIGRIIADDCRDFLSPDSMLIRCDTRGRSAGS